MTIAVQIKGVQQVLNMLGALPDTLQDQALGMALNKVADKARTTATRAITGVYNIKADTVRNLIKVGRARRNARHSVATLKVFNSKSGKRSLNLIHFLENKVSLAEWRKRGKNGTQRVLRFKIRRDKPAVAIRGAFLLNKKVPVFERYGKERSAIAPMQVIDVPGMFKAHIVIDQVVARVQTELVIEVERATALLLARLARGEVRA